MSGLCWLALIAVVLLPMAWLTSEFRSGPGVRITLGLASIACSFGVAFIAAQLVRLNYNAWYGTASERLIQAVIAETEARRTDHVLQILKRLDEEFGPTYENKGHYDELVQKTVDDLNSETPSH